jgi:hypothetical protein
MLLRRNINNNIYIIHSSNIINIKIIVLNNYFITKMNKSLLTSDNFVFSNHIDDTKYSSKKKKNFFLYILQMYWLYL